MKVTNVKLVNIFEISIFSMIGCLFITCGQTEVEEELYINVEQELWPYFQKFEKEGLARGLKIDLANSGVTGKLTTLPNKGTVGLCYDGSIQSKQGILIDQSFWERSSELSKEFIVFHELGHCYLGRPHVDKVANGGFCASIMRSGNGSCIDFYTNKNRTELLDELFSEN